MFGLLSALAFIIAFVMYALSAGKAPFDAGGVVIIGFIFLALHLVWGVYPWRRPPA